MSLSRFFLSFIALALFMLAAPPSPKAEAVGGHDIRVLVLPMEMHSATDISRDRKIVMEAFASQLAAEGAVIVGMDEIRERMAREGFEGFGPEEAFEMAETVKADFVVTGSLTRLERTLNADWQVLDPAERSTMAFYFKSASDASALAHMVGSSAPAMVKQMGAALRERPVEKTGVVDRIAITGNRRVDTEAIARKLTSAAGKPYDPDDVRADIRALHGMGYFDDITVELADTASGKILTFDLRELPFIRDIETKGNDEVKTETINAVLTLQVNTVLDRTVLAENVEKIKALYTTEGFYLAEVRPEIDTDGVDATVTFRITENEEVKVKRITFIGNEFFTARELKGFINTKEAGPLSVFTESGKFSEFFFQNDLAIILSKYYDNGFIEAEIVDHRVLLSEDKKFFIITIAVSEGAQYRVGSLDARGEILTSRDDILEKLGLEKGEIFDRSKMGKGLERISDMYGDEGYAYADIKPVTKVNPDDRTIDLTLDISKNDLVYIERIDIIGNVRTRDKVVRRELELEEGKLFSSSELKRSRNNLRRLGYFDEVQISRSPGSAPDRMKLDVEIKERPTGSVSVGIGYSSVDHVIGTASISQSNFMGTGIKLDLSGTVSGSSSRYVLSITEPWLFDRPISAGFDLYNTDKEYPDFSIREKGGSVRFGFPLWQRYTRMHLTYKLEDVNISDVDEDAALLIREQEGRSTESSVKALVRHDTRNDAFFPTEGTVITASVEFAGGPLGGTNWFIKYEGDAVKYFPLPWDMAFSLRGALGFVQGYQSHDVPIKERYFLGGINTLRGFETRSVGPRDTATGDIIGGNYMMVFNTELVFPLFSQQNMRGVVFFDAGNAYESGLDFDDIRMGAGAGVRWYSPMGPLRLELGFNLDRRDGEKAQNWEFTIGSLF